MSLFTWKRNKKGKTKDKDRPVLDLKKGEGHGDEDDFELPPSLTRNRERNLSISRSGRHKVKKHQRTTVMSEEVYSPEGAPTSPGWPKDNHVTSASTPSTVTHTHSNVQSNMTPAGGGATYHCRETVDSSTSKLSGSQRMARAPTAV